MSNKDIKNLFNKNLKILAAKIDSHKVNNLLNNKHFKEYLLRIPKIVNVNKTENENIKLILLNIHDKSELNQSALDLLNDQHATLLDYNIQLDYSHFNADQILKSVLPHDLIKDGTPTSFAQTGHLAHFNLRSEYLPYKNLIGQVILDKNPKIRTVVNKLETIDNKFRVFPMELLAGEEDYVVTTKECDTKFTFDFSKVYWNSRLSTEHERLVKKFRPFEAIADVFAGVGPFAVPGGRNSVRFLANDLNPESYKWLEYNIKLNKVQNFVKPFNEDGREFIKNAFKIVNTSPFQRCLPFSTHKELKEFKKKGANDDSYGDEKNYIDHYVMNLPASAIEFLDSFKEVYLPLQIKFNDDKCIPLNFIRPMIHVHCFSKASDKLEATTEICERASKSLGCEVHPTMENFDLYHVRSVAPNKEMFCLSFRLPNFYMTQY